LRIAIDAIGYALGRGCRVYLENLLPRLAKIGTWNQFVVFLTPSDREQLDLNAPNVHSVEVPEAEGSPLKRLLWQRVKLPPLLTKYQADVVFSPLHVLPFSMPCPSVVTMHNILPYDLKNWMPRSAYHIARLFLLRLLTELSVRRATHSIFVSETLARTILAANNLPTSRSTRWSVIYLGRSPHFGPQPSVAAEALLRSKWNINGPFLLCVAPFASHKRHLELVRAYAILIQERVVEFPLVLAGSLDRHSKYVSLVRSEIVRQGLDGRVRLLGHVPYADLPAVYVNATLFIFPSAAEACPNILIEAMACGSPIAASNVSAMPEICGDAAAYFDPFCPTDIARCVADLLQCESLRRELSMRALSRAEHFSWDTCAAKTHQVLTAVANRHRLSSSGSG
jgi:glycosyltransferase involved in cell wall biosynthesis